MQPRIHGCVDHAEINLASIPAPYVDGEISPAIVLCETGDSYGFVRKHFGCNMKPFLCCHTACIHDV